MATSKRATPFRVFIVDDSQIMVDRVLLMLQDVADATVAGYAHDITSALYFINKLMPDAVLLDIHLKKDWPAANGIDLLSSLRSSYPSMNIIMLTNLATPEYIRKCMALGADHFLDKTNDFDKIPETIRKLQGLN